MAFGAVLRAKRSLLHLRLLGSGFVDFSLWPSRLEIRDRDSLLFPFTEFDVARDESNLEPAHLLFIAGFHPRSVDVALLMEFDFRKCELLRPHRRRSRDDAGSLLPGSFFRVVSIDRRGGPPLFSITTSGEGDKGDGKYGPVASLHGCQPFKQDRKLKSETMRPGCLRGRNAFS